MNTIQRLICASTFALSLAARADIISVSLPPQTVLVANGSYPVWDSLFTVSVPPYPLDTARGIGRILNDPGLGFDVERFLFTLQVNSYGAPYVPAPDSIITYTFDTPTVIDQLELIQHQNGVTRIEGFIGNNLTAMTSIGNVFSPLGDIRGRNAFVDGDITIFSFANMTPGTIFQFRITQTSLIDGYALYRAYPRDATGRRIPPAECAALSIRVSEVEISWQSRANRSYTIEYSENLATNSWAPLQTNIGGNGGTMRIYDRVEPGTPRRFYRVQCLIE